MKLRAPHGSRLKRLEEGYARRLILKEELLDLVRGIDRQ